MGCTRQSCSRVLAGGISTPCSAPTHCLSRIPASSSPPFCLLQAGFLSNPAPNLEVSVCRCIVAGGLCSTASWCRQPIRMCKKSQLNPQACWCRSPTIGLLYYQPSAELRQGYAAPVATLRQKQYRDNAEGKQRTGMLSANKSMYRAF